MTGEAGGDRSNRTTWSEFCLQHSGRARGHALLLQAHHPVGHSISPCKLPVGHRDPPYLSNTSSPRSLCRGRNVGGNLPAGQGHPACLCWLPMPGAVGCMYAPVRREVQSAESQELNWFTGRNIARSVLAPAEDFVNLFSRSNENHENGVSLNPVDRSVFTTRSAKPIGM